MALPDIVARAGVALTSTSGKRSGRVKPAAGAPGRRVLGLGHRVRGVGHAEAALAGVGEDADHVGAGLRRILGGVLQDERESGAALPHGGAELRPVRVGPERALRHDERSRLRIERGAGDKGGVQRARQLLPGGERRPEGYDLAEAPAGVTGHLEERLDERSEEHTSELQSQSNLVCRLLLEKKKKK